MTDQNTTTPPASQKQNEPSVEQVFTPSVDAFQGSAPQVPNADAAPQAAPFSPAGGSSPQAAPVPPVGNVPPQSAFVPPTAGMPPQPGCASGPQNIPGLPLVHLTGGMKFGWPLWDFSWGRSPSCSPGLRTPIISLRRKRMRLSSPCSAFWRSSLSGLCSSRFSGALRAPQ